MKKNYKQSVSDALEKFHKKEWDKYKPKDKPRRRNQKPEKLVELECKKLMDYWGWSVDIFEAKATWNPKAGCWLQQGMKAGVCDCLGSTERGVAVAIEFKAPGKLASFNSPRRTKQREFILAKIEANNFACVVDSAAKLNEIYTHWLTIENPARAKEYLYSVLPVKRRVGPIGSDDLDF